MFAFNPAFPESPSVSSERFSQKFSIPSELGTIEEFGERFNPEAPFVFYVKDAHAHYEAQIKIKKLLDLLARQYGFKLLLVEGAQAKLEPERFHFFDEAGKNLKVADLLMREGEFSGPEYFLLENFERKKDGIEGFGVEDAELYRENLLAFRRVYAQAEEAERFVRRMDLEIESLGTRFWPSSLRHFVKSWRHFQGPEKRFLAFIEALRRAAKKHLNIDLENPRAQLDYPHLVRVIKLRELESSLDFRESEKEKTALVGLLRENHLNPSLIREFETRLGSGNSGRGSAAEDLRSLFEKIYRDSPQDFNLKNYPHFSLLSGHLILKNEIESGELMKEIDGLSEELFSSLAKDSEAKELIRLLKNSFVLRKLLRLELVRDEWTMISDRKEDVKPEVFFQRLDEMNGKKGKASLPAEELAGVNGLFDRALTFYEGAKSREEGMMENIRRRMKENGGQRAVFITGGFHADGIKEKLKAAGMNYVIFSPALSKDGGQEDYLKSILGRKSPAASTIKNAAYLLQEESQTALGAFVAERQEMIDAACAEAASLGAASEDIYSTGTEESYRKDFNREVMAFVQDRSKLSSAVAIGNIASSQAERKIVLKMAAVENLMKKTHPPFTERYQVVLLDGPEASPYFLFQDGGDFVAATSTKEADGSKIYVTKQLFEALSPETLAFLLEKQGHHAYELDGKGRAKGDFYRSGFHGYLLKAIEADIENFEGGDTATTPGGREQITLDEGRKHWLERRYPYPPDRGWSYRTPAKEERWAGEEMEKLIAGNAVLRTSQVKKMIAVFRQTRLPTLTLWTTLRYVASIAGQSPEERDWYVRYLTNQYEKLARWQSRYSSLKVKNAESVTVLDNQPQYSAGENSLNGGRFTYNSRDGLMSLKLSENQTVPVFLSDDHIDLFPALGILGIEGPLAVISKDFHDDIGSSPVPFYAPRPPTLQDIWDYVRSYGHEGGIFTALAKDRNMKSLYWIPTSLFRSLAYYERLAHRYEVLPGGKAQFSKGPKGGRAGIPLDGEKVSTYAVKPVSEKSAREPEAAGILPATAEQFDFNIVPENAIQVIPADDNLSYVLSVDLDAFNETPAYLFEEAIHHFVAQIMRLDIHFKAVFITPSSPYLDYKETQQYWPELLNCLLKALDASGLLARGASLGEAADLQEKMSQVRRITHTIANGILGMSLDGELLRRSLIEGIPRDTDLYQAFQEFLDLLEICASKKYRFAVASEDRFKDASPGERELILILEGLKHVRNVRRFCEAIPDNVFLNSAERWNELFQMPKGDQGFLSLRDRIFGQARTVLEEIGRFHEAFAAGASTETFDVLPFLRDYLGFNQEVSGTRFVFEHQDAKLELEGDENIPVTMNAFQFGDLIHNLLMNSLRTFGGTGGGAARARVGREGNFAKVEIEDNGEGIPGENLARIFEMFFSTKTADGELHGQGLALVLETVEKYGGTIEVISKVKGGKVYRALKEGDVFRVGEADQNLISGESGTIFIVRLPLTVEAGKSLGVSREELDPFNPASGIVYQYDEKGRLIAVKDALGNTWEEYSYGSNGFTVDLANIKGGTSVKLMADIKNPRTVISGNGWRLFDCGVEIDGVYTGHVILYEFGRKNGSELVREIFQFYPFDAIEPERLSGYEGRGFAETILNWLTASARRDNAILSSTGTSNLALLHLYRKFFAEEVKIKGEWRKLPDVIREFGEYGENFLGAVSVTDKSFLTSLPFALINLVREPGEDSYRVHQSSNPSKIPSGEVIGVKEGGVLFRALSGERIGIASRSRHSIVVQGNPRPVSASKSTDGRIELFQDNQPLQGSSLGDVFIGAGPESEYEDDVLNLAYKAFLMTCLSGNPLTREAVIALASDLYHMALGRKPPEGLFDSLNWAALPEEKGRPKTDVEANYLWQMIAGNSDETPAVRCPAYQQMILDQIPKGRKLKILSLGAGKGQIETKLKGLGHEVYAVDIVPAVVSDLNARGIKAYQGDINRLAMIAGITDAGPFDAVLMIDSVGYVADVGQLLFVLKTLAAPNYRLIVSTYPNYSRIQTPNGHYQKGMINTYQRELEFSGHRVRSTHEYYWDDQKNVMELVDWDDRKGDVVLMVADGPANPQAESLGQSGGSDSEPERRLAETERLSTLLPLINRRIQKYGIRWLVEHGDFSWEENGLMITGPGLGAMWSECGSGAKLAGAILDENGFSDAYVMPFPLKTRHYLSPLKSPENPEGMTESYLQHVVAVTESGFVIDTTDWSHLYRGEGERIIAFPLERHPFGDEIRKSMIALRRSGKLERVGNFNSQLVSLPFYYVLREPEDVLTVPTLPAAFEILDSSRSILTELGVGFHREKDGTLNFLFQYQIAHNVYEPSGKIVRVPQHWVLILELPVSALFDPNRRIQEWMKFLAEKGDPDLMLQFLERCFQGILLDETGSGNLQGAPDMRRALIVAMREHLPVLFRMIAGLPPIPEDELERLIQDAPPQGRPDIGASLGATAERIAPLTGESWTRLYSDAWQRKKQFKIASAASLGEQKSFEERRRSLAENALRLQEFLDGKFGADPDLREGLTATGKIRSYEILRTPWYVRTGDFYYFPYMMGNLKQALAERGNRFHIDYSAYFKKSRYDRFLEELDPYGDNTIIAHIGPRRVFAPWLDFAYGYYTLSAILAMMERTEEIAGTRGLDAGTGDGILSATALRLGAEEMVGIDSSDLWIPVATHLRQMNGFPKEQLRLRHMDFGEADEHSLGKFDFIVANLKNWGLISDEGSGNWHEVFLSQFPSAQAYLAIGKRLSHPLLPGLRRILNSEFESLETPLLLPQIPVLSASGRRPGPIHTGASMGDEDSEEDPARWEEAERLAEERMEREFEAWIERGEEEERLEGLRADQRVGSLVLKYENIVPTVTPLTPEGMIDRAGIRKLVIHLVSLGVKSVLVMGATGEFMKLNHDQRLEAIRIFAEEARGRLRIFANATGDTEEETVENLLQIHRIEGIEAAVLAPLYYLEDSSKVVRHFERIERDLAAAGIERKLPLVLYNNPGITRGLNLEPAVVGQLKGNIAALKDSSGKPDLLREYLEYTAVYQGDEMGIVSALLAGAKGGVSSMGNVNAFPQLLFGEEQGSETQRTLQETLNGIVPDLTAGRAKIVAGIKYYLSELGIIGSTLAGNASGLTKRERARVASLARAVKAERAERAKQDRKKSEAIFKADASLLDGTQKLIRVTSHLAYALDAEVLSAAIRRLRENLNAYEDIPLFHLRMLERGIDITRRWSSMNRRSRKRVAARLDKYKEETEALIRKKTELDRMLEETQDLRIGELPRDAAKKQKHFLNYGSLLALRLSMIAGELPDNFVNLNARLREISKGIREWARNPGAEPGKISGYAAALRNIAEGRRGRSRFWSERVRTLAEELDVLVEQANPPVPVIWEDGQGVWDFFGDRGGTAQSLGETSGRAIAREEKRVAEEVTGRIFRIYPDREARLRWMQELGLMERAGNDFAFLETLSPAIRPLFAESNEFGVAVASVNSLENVQRMEAFLNSNRNKILLVYYEGPESDEALQGKNLFYREKFEGRIQLVKAREGEGYAGFLGTFLEGGRLASDLRARARTFFNRAGNEGVLSQNELLKSLTVVAREKVLAGLRSPFVRPFHSRDLAIEPETREFAELVYSVIGSGRMEAEALRKQVGDNLEIRLAGNGSEIAGLALSGNAVGHYLELLTEMKTVSESIARAA